MQYFFPIFNFYLFFLNKLKKCVKINVCFYVSISTF